jgi:hypothetical protein
MNQRKITLTLVALSILSCFAQHEVAAQSTILNTPSTDVVATKKVYVEMDFITNYAWERGDTKFANYLPRTVIGVGHNIEAGVNVSFAQVPGGGAPIELQPNAKWQFYRNEEKGLAAAAGCIWYLPITHRAGTDTLGQCYSVASKKVSGALGPRFTGGGYVLVGASSAERTKAGAIVAYEQPFSRRTGFLLDWLSGNNRFGSVSPGLYVLTPHNGSLSAGYTIANHGRGKNALFVYYGTQF